MRAETESVARRLLVLTAALTALDLGVDVPLVFDDSTGFV